MIGLAEKPAMQRYSEDHRRRSGRSSSSMARLLACLLLLAAAGAGAYWQLLPVWPTPRPTPPAPGPQPPSAPHDVAARCAALNTPAGPPEHFAQRRRSDRAKPADEAPRLVVRNATVFTGRDEEVRHGADVWLEHGLIRDVTDSSAARSTDGWQVVEAHGRWVTPGIVDIHVHAGVYSLPSLAATMDHNSAASTLTPSLRSLDGLNPHDVSFERIASGGTTTGLVLPGSANNVGGQAFPIKLGKQTRSDARLGGWKRVIDPPASLALPREEQHTGNEDGMARAPGQSAFRYMKMACGENARRRYDLTRMDEARAFRGLFERARTLKDQQDAFCARVKSKGPPPSDEPFPDDIELEAVVDVLRGKVKVNTHCYTGIDLEAYVRHTNEFKFPLAAFHHAHEAYLVPDLLKRTYGGTPAVALFSLNGNYKFEAIAGSPFAPAILASHNITVHLKSDHPVTDSRHVLNQAAQAAHYGFPNALTSMTSGAARTLGLDHRLGYVLPKYDADLVLWDRAPLSLGATPLQVIIDGVPQLDGSLAKAAVQHPVSDKPGPPAADFAAELRRVNESGPDIIALQASATPLPYDRASDVTFTNVSVVFARTSRGKIERTELRGGEVQVLDGKIACAGKVCASSSIKSRKIDLRGGTIIPGLTTLSGDLGLADITSELDTTDGFASARSSFAALVGDDARPLARAADVIQWGGNDALRTHAAGFTSVVSAPRSQGFVSGLSARWAPGALDAWEHSAINSSVVALHAEISHLQTSQARSALSEAEQIGLLRALLRAGSDRIHAHATSASDNADVWQRVVRGDLPLVVAASRAERLGALVKLAHEHPHMRLVLAGAHEAAHGGLPDALARAKVGVLLRPQTWNVEYDARRDLPGPPLSRDTTLSVLRKAGVKVGFQLEEAWQATSLLWDAAWAAEQAGLPQAEAIELVSTNVESMLGLEASEDFVAFDGSPFEYGAKVVAIGSQQRVDLML